MSFFRYLTLFTALVSAVPVAAADPKHTNTKEFVKLEKIFGARIGIYALDTHSGATLAHRAHERFPLCSSFKGFLAAAVLARSQQDHKLLNKHIRYGSNALPSWSPVTEKHIATGMSVGEMAAATLKYSDNGAANMLLKEIGGPAALTAFMRSIGDTTFRLDRIEPEMNTAIPGDERDTSSPFAVAKSLEKLVLGPSLGPAERQQFLDWLKGNTTGQTRIRAGTPSGWIVGDKTGTCGVYGTANDYAVIYPPGRRPIVLAIYTTKTAQHARPNEEIFATATRLTLKALGVKQ